MSLIIGALSCQKTIDRQDTVSKSWFGMAIKAGIKARFLIGHPELNTTYEDNAPILKVQAPDDYPHLPMKTRIFCRWALQFDDWDFLFKCDDDTFICLDRLLDALPSYKDYDYIGNTWRRGLSYGSGGAGYLLSRKAATIVATDLDQETGSEDLLVGDLLRSRLIKLFVDKRYIPFGNEEKAPKLHNDIITTHGISKQLFEKIDSINRFDFDILIPTYHKFMKYIPVMVNLLHKFWPSHPNIFIAADGEKPWTTVLLDKLRTMDSQYVLLMLDDYGICARPNMDKIKYAVNQLNTDYSVSYIHLTPQPVQTIEYDDVFQEIPKSWAYFVNTQAAIWRRNMLIDVLEKLGPASVENFELQGSKLLDGKVLQFVNTLPVPAMVDKMDKSSWALPYHNLSHRGKPDVRHTDFIKEHCKNGILE